MDNLGKCHMLAFSSELSDSGILALGLGKEGFHQGGQFLDPAQSADCRQPHLDFGLHQLTRDLAFDMRPDLFIWIQLRRVRRQIEGFAVLRNNEFLDQHCLVDRVTINDQEDRSRLANQQAFQKFPEDVGLDRSIVQHEAEFTPRADRRNHVQRETPDGNFHHGCLTHRRLSRAGVVIRANSRLVRKVDCRPLGFGVRANFRVDLRFPGAHQRRILLPRLIERLLYRETEQRHDPADRCQRQFLAKLTLDQCRNQRQGSQSESNLELQRRIVFDGLRQPAHFFLAHLGWATGDGRGQERVLSAVGKVRQPAEDTAHIYAIRRGNTAHVMPFTNCLDSLLTHHLQRLVRVLAAIRGSFAFHARIVL